MVLAEPTPILLLKITKCPPGKPLTPAPISSDFPLKTMQAWIGWWINGKNLPQTKISVPEAIATISRSCLANRMDFGYRMGGLITDQDELTGLLKSYPDNSSTKEEWQLNMGSELLSGMQDVELSIQEEKFFEEGAKSCLEKLKAQDKKKLLNMFYKSRWSAAYKEPCTIIANVAAFYLLQKYGVSFEKISGMGKGLYAALIVSGLIDFKDYYQVKQGHRKWSEIEIKRPNLPFYDQSNNTILYPIRTTDCASCTLQQDSAYEGELAFFVKKAKELLPHQFTFKKLMTKWDEATEGKILKCLENPSKEKSRRMLLLIAIASSLEKINKKWTLSDNQRINCEATNQWIRLLIDGLVTEKEVADFIISSKIDNICEKLTVRIEEGKGIQKADFPSHAGFNALGKIENSDEWITTHEKIRGTSYIKNKDFKRFVLGQKRVSPLKSLLYHFWMGGQNINWSLLVEKGNLSEQLNLPVYPFAKDRYWIPRSRAYKTGKDVLTPSGAGEYFKFSGTKIL